ncbi:uncharacterized protein GGS22DRAFT_147000 [Annulohypoxylon maeteangense]|uniref:uncharacterized protein n=1 Tax=Annulohypoxylon maeteangense TaxID=1927788 RepID=UPI002008B293|nr:uncharacterized protein GGS22DRAFT_147000 [Annulohypoxylon maeteangense]KAI0884802.1 hypothetical protein GGS22DRAFT_147000 [Annulohypoxylon maeteangense]
MDLSPPSLTRSPASPPSTNCSDSPTLDYPSPDFVDPIYKIASMFEQQSCATMSNNMGSENSLPPLDMMTSAGWSGTAVMHPSSTSGAPNIMSADYDTFAHYEPSMHASYSHELYSSHPSQAPVLSSSTPPPMSSGASRSPDPNSRHAFGYSHSVSPIPRIKMENPNAMTADYGNGPELTQYPSPRSAQSLPLEPNSYGSTAGSSGYLSDVPSGSWPKSEYPSLESDQFYAGPSASGAFPHDRRQLRVPRAQRRQPRKLTTKEEANFQCEVKGCGKLFSRSYNFKAHMETHDEKREYPFPCTVPDCNKKFVRKTDLQRHNQSVHMKEKNHKCDYCGRMFARKDTLRRHMEDGCAKRFDLGTLDLRADGYDAYPAPTRTLGSTPGHLVAPATQLPPVTMPQQHQHQHHGNLLAPMPFTKR